MVPDHVTMVWLLVHINYNHNSTRAYRLPVFHTGTQYYIAKILATSSHSDLSIIHNSMGKFLTFKGQLYVPRNLVPTILYEYHDA